MLTSLSVCKQHATAYSQRTMIQVEQEDIATVLGNKSG